MAGNRVAEFDVSEARRRESGFDAECDHAAWVFLDQREASLDAGCELFLGRNEMVRCEHGEDGVGVSQHQHRRGQGDGVHGVARARLANQPVRIKLIEIFKDEIAMRFPRADPLLAWRNQAIESARRVPEQALALNEWHHLFGAAGSAHRPQPRSATAGHDHCVLHSVKGSAQAVMFDRAGEMAASGPLTNSTQRSSRRQHTETGYASCVLARITGQLVGIADGRAQIAVGPMVIDVMVPGSDIESLERRRGQDIEFHTMLVLEAIGQGSSMVPRLLGFASAHDRAFFELFTTVKNIGHRKALKALQMPAAEIAAAIVRRDTATLVGLPEIGKRTAETIIAELSGKVDAYLDSAVATTVTGDTTAGSMLSDAMVMLMALGERPDTARQLAERSMSQNPDLDTPEDLLAHIMATR